MNKEEKTLFEMWKEGLIGNFGCFQTTIFEAYKIADCRNMKRLEEAFPNWFVKKFPQTN